MEQMMSIKNRVITWFNSVASPDGFSSSPESPSSAKDSRSKWIMIPINETPKCSNGIVLSHMFLDSITSPSAHKVIWHTRILEELPSFITKSDEWYFLICIYHSGSFSKFRKERINTVSCNFEDLRLFHVKFDLRFQTILQQTMHLTKPH